MVNRCLEFGIYHQVAPAELEALLLTHPDVSDVAVIGVPDDEVGELPKAFIVPKDPENFSEEDVFEFLYSEQSLSQFHPAFLSWCFTSTETVWLNY